MPFQLSKYSLPQNETLLSACRNQLRMWLGILSDTHDELARTQRALEILQANGAETLVHCGDLSSPPVLIACSVLPCYFVFGNHDADEVPVLLKTAAKIGAYCLGWGGVIEVAGKRVGIAHGHMTADVRRVLASAPDYLLSGHSHEKSDEVRNGVRRINPGALYRADEFTVALLEIETGELRFLLVD